MEKSLAQIAYYGYSEFLKWNSITEEIPTWQELSTLQKEAWMNAAEEVATKIRLDQEDE